jgi:hypothetical protein
MILWNSPLILAPSNPNPLDNGSLANYPVLSPNEISISTASNEPDNDDDSALGDVDDTKSTQTVDSLFFDPVPEHGRGYHAYCEEKNYFMPNDGREQDRLDLQHHLFTLTFGGQLHICPGISGPGRVLDIGAGTGIWAMDFGDKHPSSEVLGVDISPFQPSFVPPNVTFQLDDVEKEWTYAHEFDFIHSRMMAGGIKEWPRFIEQSFE